MNEIVIRILDNDNNVKGDLELSNYENFPLAITKGIVNLDSLKDRTGTYTKSFRVPNTKNNASLLSNVENINSRKDFRRSLDRKPCVVLVNNNPIEKGFVQVSKVFNGFNVDSFELVFFGNNIDWVKDASGLKVNEIPFNNSEQTYDLTSIRSINNSAININNAEDFAYPYVSRGGNELATEKKLSTEDFTPCFFLEKILLRGFNSLGWNINSTFLDSESSRGLICDLNSEMKVSQSTIDDSKVKTTKTSALDITSEFDTTGTTYKMVFDDDATGGNEDINDVYNTTTGAYKADSTGSYTIDLKIPHKVVIGGAFLNGRWYVEVRKGTDTVYGNTTLLKSIEVLSDLTPALLDTTFDVKLQKDEILSIHVLKFRFNTSGSANFQIGTYLVDSLTQSPKFNASRSIDIKEDDVFDVKELIPDSIRLIDVLNDFTRMFNIYYWTDVKTRTVYFEPRDLFFKDRADAINWTNKIDIKNMYEVDYVTSYKRDMVFGYKDVDGDEWLKGWQSKNRRTYAEYTHELPNRFTEGKTVVNLSLFSATYPSVCKEATLLKNEAFTSLKCWGEYLNTEGIPEDRIDGYNPRVFNFKNSTQLNKDGSNRRITYSDNITSNFIPFGVFEPYNNTYVGNGYNLSFTDTTNEDGTTQKGLFNNFYSKMLKNIEEGGRLIAYFNLTSSDIENLDFRKLVYLDNDSNIKGYYLIEKVIDYKPLKNGLTKVSLFKFENLGSVVIDGGQNGANDVDTDEGEIQTPLQPIFVEDGNQIIEVYALNPLTGILEPVYK